MDIKLIGLVLIGILTLLSWIFQWRLAAELQASFPKLWQNCGSPRVLFGKPDSARAWLKLVFGETLSKLNDSKVSFLVKCLRIFWAVDALALATFAFLILAKK